MSEKPVTYYDPSIDEYVPVPQPLTQDWMDKFQRGSIVAGFKLRALKELTALSHVNDADKIKKVYDILVSRG